MQKRIFQLRQPINAHPQSLERGKSAEKSRRFKHFHDLPHIQQSLRRVAANRQGSAVERQGHKNTNGGHGTGSGSIQSASW